MDTEARALFQAGATAFNDGRYEDALGHFRRSYELSGRPALLANIGTTLDRLRRDDEAIETFEAYLEHEPDAPNRREIEGRLRVLRAHDGDDAAQTTEPPPDTSAPEGSATPRDESATTPREEPDRGGSLLPWVAGGVAVAFAGASLTVWLMGDAAYSDLEASCGGRGCTEQEIDESGVETLDTLTNVFLVGSGLALAGAAVLFFMESGESDAEGPAVSIGVGPGAIALRGRLP